jgi:lipopolysaccharide/colanic/teichoic acid biosynthesis glycosyltransferase
MKSVESNAAGRTLDVEAQIEQLNEAARWLEEHRPDAMRHSGVLLLPPTIVPRSRRNYAVKRVFDFCVALLSLIILSPFLLLLGLLVRLDSRGPALFKQERVGEGGKRFICYKFRSMRTDADDAIHREAIRKFMQGEKLAGDNDAAGAYKIARDPRITRMGAFLRATSIDELPQLINVVQGNMSLVGPRPALPYEVEQYRYRHRYRLLVKPGITGVWQVYGRSRVDFESLVSMDLNYVTDGTFWLDLKLIVLTFSVVFKKSGGG